MSTLTAPFSARHPSATFRRRHAAFVVIMAAALTAILLATSSAAVRSSAPIARAGHSTATTVGYVLSPYSHSLALACTAKRHGPQHAAAHRPA